MELEKEHFKGKCSLIQKWEKIFSNFIEGLFAIIIVYMFIASMVSTCVAVYTDEHIFYIKDYAFVLGIGLVIFLLTLLWFAKKAFLTPKLVDCILLAETVVWFIAVIAFIWNTKLFMAYDQRIVLQGAEQLVRGDFSWWMPYNYFYLYPYINGMVLMEAPFTVWLSAERACIVLQFANVLFIYGSIVILSLMAGMRYGEKVKKGSYGVLLLFAPFWLYVTFAYGTLPGLFFGVLAFYFEQLYEEKREWKYILFSLASMMFSVAWKSNYQIFLIALFLSFLFDGIRNKSGAAFIGAASAILLLTLELPLISQIIHWITGESVSGGTPTISWIAMGLQESSIAPGWYNGYTEIIPEASGRSIEVMKDMAWENIGDTLVLFTKEPMYCMSFFFRKIASMWNEPSFQAFTIVTKRNVNGNLSYGMKDLLYDGGTKNVLLRLYMDITHSITLFGLVLHVIFNRQQNSLKTAVCKITFLGGFFFHLAWEAMTQYALPFYVLLIPLAVQGYYITIQKCKNYLNDRVSIKTIFGFRGVKYCFLIAGLTILITISNASIVTSSIKLSGEEKDYIWYCQNETEWKSDDYAKR